jgi:hypothetical protein
LSNRLTRFFLHTSPGLQAAQGLTGSSTLLEHELEPEPLASPHLAPVTDHLAAFDHDWCSLHTSTPGVPSPSSDYMTTSIHSSTAIPGPQTHSLHFHSTRSCSPLIPSSAIFSPAAAAAAALRRGFHHTSISSYYCTPACPSPLFQAPHCATYPLQSQCCPPRHLGSSANLTSTSTSTSTPTRHQPHPRSSHPSPSPSSHHGEPPRPRTIHRC